MIEVKDEVLIETIKQLENAGCRLLNYHDSVKRSNIREDAKARICAGIWSQAEALLDQSVLLNGLRNEVYTSGGAR